MIKLPKVFVIDVPQQFRPASQGYIMPPHSDDFGVEQDFDLWLRQQPGLTTDDPAEADWFFLPVFWNRLFIKTWHWASDEQKMAEATGYIEALRQSGLDFSRTFTVCEWDPLEERPEIDVSGMMVFTAGRRGEGGIDIPLLCTPHKQPQALPAKEWLACFVGNIGTSSWRAEMQDALAGRPDCLVEHAQKGTSYFRDTMLKSHVALAPRGFRGQSFRFYEAMDLGVAPMLIGDMDTRPFKNWVPWDDISYYVPTGVGLSEVLDTLDAEEALRMGERAKAIYHSELKYGRWGRFVISELLSVP